MTTAGKVALGVSVVLAGALIGVLVAAVRDDDGAVRPGGRATMEIDTSVPPSVHLFADPIVAHVDLLFDKRRVNPDRIVVDAVFRPYEQVSPPVRERSDVANAVRVRYSYPLQCFARACAPTSGRNQVQWPPVRVTYTLVEAQARANDVEVWPPVDVASRLGPSDIQEAGWRADLTPPEVSYRVSPGWLAAGLAGSSLLLVLGAGMLAAWLLRSRPEEALAGAQVDAVPPLSRAIDRVVRASSNGSMPERRRALEQLARELDRADEPALATRTRRLAWSAAEPSGDAAAALAAEVRGAVAEEDDGRAP